MKYLKVIFSTIKKHHSNLLKKVNSENEKSKNKKIISLSPFGRVIFYISAIVLFFIITIFAVLPLLSFFVVVSWSIASHLSEWIRIVLLGLIFLSLTLSGIYYFILLLSILYQKLKIYKIEVVKKNEYSVQKDSSVFGDRLREEGSANSILNDASSRNDDNIKIKLRRETGASRYIDPNTIKIKNVKYEDLVNNVVGFEKILEIDNVNAQIELFWCAEIYMQITANYYYLKTTGIEQNLMPWPEILLDFDVDTRNEIELLLHYRDALRTLLFIQQFKTKADSPLVQNHKCCFCKAKCEVPYIGINEKHDFVCNNCKKEVTLVVIQLNNSIEKQLGYKNEISGYSIMRLILPRLHFEFDSFISHFGCSLNESIRWYESKNSMKPIGWDDYKRLLEESFSIEQFIILISSTQEKIKILSKISFSHFCQEIQFPSTIKNYQIQDKNRTEESLKLKRAVLNVEKLKNAMNTSSITSSMDKIEFIKNNQWKHLNEINIYAIMMLFNQRKIHSKQDYIKYMSEYIYSEMLTMIILFSEYEKITSKIDNSIDKYANNLEYLYKQKEIKNKFVRNKENYNQLLESNAELLEYREYLKLESVALSGDDDAVETIENTLCLDVIEHQVMIESISLKIEGLNLNETISLLTGFRILSDPPTRPPTRIDYFSYRDLIGKTTPLFLQQNMWRVNRILGHLWKNNVI